MPYIKKNRTIIITAAIFFTGLLVMNIAHYKSSIAAFEKNLKESFLPATADLIMDSINERHETFRAASGLIAQNIEFSRFMTDGVEDSNKIRQFLQSSQKALNIKNIGLVSLESNMYYDSAGQTLTLDYTSERDKWVIDFISYPQNYNFSIYDPENQEEENLYSFFHDYKIRDAEGKATGIFGIGLDIGDLYKNPSIELEDVKIFFTDYEGNFRLPVEMRGSNITERYNLSNHFFDLNHPTQSKETMKDLFIAGDSYFLFFRKIPELERYMLVEFGPAFYYANIRKQFFLKFIIGTIFSIVLVSVNIFLILRSNRKLSSRAYIDPLTKIYNRSFLEHISSSDCSLVFEDNTGISLIALDIDNFKEINDTQGHIKGDQVLKNISSIAKKHIRDNDYIIRWGGDEFIIILHADIEKAAVICERIRMHIEQQSDATITAGVTEINLTEKFETALARADAALYRGKSEGRNRVLTA